MMDRETVRNVKFYSKNKFEKLVYLVGFIIRIYHDARSPERQTCFDPKLEIQLASSGAFRTTESHAVLYFAIF